MVVYYISYGEPQRQPLWRPLLLILLITLALATAAAIAYGIYELASGNGSGDPPVGDDGVVSLSNALLGLYENDTNTIFLVDASESVFQGDDHLQAVRNALSLVALPYADRSTGPFVENSRVALVPFADAPESPPELVSLEAPAEHIPWLKRATNLTPSDRPAYIYDTVAVAYKAFAEQDKSGRGNVIVLLTDGNDGGYRPVSSPVKPDDVVVPCPPKLNEPGKMCSVLKSEHTEEDLIILLGTRGDQPNVKVHTIGLGADANQQSLALLAKASGGLTTHCPSVADCKKPE